MIKWSNCCKEKKTNITLAILQTHLKQSISPQVGRTNVYIHPLLFLPIKVIVHGILYLRQKMWISVLCLLGGLWSEGQAETLRRLSSVSPRKDVTNALFWKMAGTGKNLSNPPLNFAHSFGRIPKTYFCVYWNFCLNLNSLQISMLSHLGKFEGFLIAI